MIDEKIWDNAEIVEVLNRGGVVVMPTDTIYGIVGRALNPDTVKRIYDIKKRSPEKKLINLISDWNEIKKFGIDISGYKVPEFNEPTSVIFNEISFRVPGSPFLRELLSQTGPLVAPSANPEGFPPATTIEEAKTYFGHNVDMYLDGGTIVGKASTLIKLQEDGEVTILRA